MKLTPKIALLIIASSIALLLPQSGQCFYNSSEGRWLSRDPVHEQAVQAQLIKLSAAGEKAAQTASTHSGADYEFVQNAPLDRVDELGLAGVTWNGSGQCPKGSTPTFAQVGWGAAGIWGSGPFVDNGSKGVFSSSTGCMEYPPGRNGYTGFFDDTPSWTAGSVQFVTCMMCTKSCCTSGTTSTGGHFKQMGRKIYQFGPCRKWKNGDSGDLSNFPTPTDAEMQTFIDTIGSAFPAFTSGECYSCKGDQKIFEL